MKKSKSISENKNTRGARRKRAPLGLGRKIILVICLIVFMGSAAILLDYYLEGLRAQKALTELGNNNGTEDLVADKGIVIGKYAELYKTNNDIIGWIKIDGTKIDYPVMQTLSDPE